MLESLLNKVADPQACSFIKKRLQHRCFPMKFTKFLRTPFLKKICERLLLNEVTKSLTKSFKHTCEGIFFSKVVAHSLSLY